MKGQQLPRCAACTEAIRCRPVVVITETGLTHLHPDCEAVWRWRRLRSRRERQAERTTMPKHLRGDA